MKSFLILFSELKQKKLLLIGIILCGALSSSFKALIAIITKPLTEIIFGQSDTLGDPLTQLNSVSAQSIIEISSLFHTKPIFIAAAGIALATIMANIFRYIFMFNLRTLTESKAVQLRERLMNHYLSLEGRTQKSENDSSGSLISRLLNDVLIYQNGLNRMSEALKEPFLVLFSLVYLFILSWKITLFLIIALPPSLIVLRRVSKSLRKHSSRNQETMEQLTMILKEGLDGARVIHSFKLEENIFTKFKKHTAAYLKTIRTIISREELAGPLTESFSAIVLGFTLVIIYFLAQNDGLKASDFVALLTAIGFLSDSSKKLQNGFIRIQQGVVAKNRIDQLISSGIQQKIPDGTQNFPSALNQIKVIDLKVNLGNKPVIGGLNLKLEAGKTVALVGPSGSGKSTFLNILDGYIPKTSGQVLFNDREISEIASDSLRQNISLVSQDPFLFDETIFENLKHAKKDLTEEEAWKALELANALFVKEFNDGLHTRVGERGSRLSGGERQRISIARAMIKNTPIILLDEATSALDTHSEIEVQKGLNHLKQGKTCFVVAHRLSTIKDADVILVFNDGLVIEQGTHEELVNHQGLYSSLYS